jgi:hypothetical protein
MLGSLMFAADADFVVTPGPFFWLAVCFWLCTLLGGLVTALKGRWGWLAAGLVFGGALWLFTAFLPAAPGSVWARRSYGQRT